MKLRRKVGVHIFNEDQVYFYWSQGWSVFSSFIGVFKIFIFAPSIIYVLKRQKLWGHPVYNPRYNTILNVKRHVLSDAVAVM